MNDFIIEQVNQELNENRSDLDEKWLTFWMEKQLFCVSIAGVEQIVSMQSITQIPEYPPYAKGIISLRGAIIPVIDLRLRMGKQEIEYTDHTCIIINRVGDDQLGFIVDEVDAVIDIPAQAVLPPPKMGDDSVNRYLLGIARITQENDKETMILCLNAAKILRDDEVGSLASAAGAVS